jgi:two-component system sensor histidine kinase UhpB
MAMLASFFSPTGFMPHGHCFLWTTGLLWAYVVSDSLIWLSYYSIPVALWYFVRRRIDLPFNWVFVMFAIFIFACGTTHLIAIWNIWQPVYWLDAGIKLATAAALCRHGHRVVATRPQGARPCRVRANSRSRTAFSSAKLPNAT